MNWMQGMAIGFLLGVVYTLFILPWLEKKLSRSK
jgi:hypothetical protein